MTIRVGVLFYSHKQSKYVTQGLDSILSQKGDFDFEVLVIDDSSRDGTGLIIENWIHEKKTLLDTKVKKFTFISDDNASPKGQTKTLLKGLQEISGDYIFVLEGDDEWIRDDHILTGVEIMENFPWISAVGSSWISLSDDNVIFGAFEKPANTSLVSSLWDSRRLLTVNFQTLSAMGYRGEHLRQVLPEVSKCKEVADLGLNLFVSQKGPLYWSDFVSLKWRWVPNSLWRSLSAKEQISRSIKMLDDYAQYLPIEISKFLTDESLRRKNSMKNSTKLVFGMKHPKFAFKVLTSRVFAFLKN